MTTAREKLIVAAVGLIRTHGVPGTTVADLLQRSGVARRSLYLNFPAGRQELIEEASRLAGAGMSEGLSALLSTVDSPIDAVAAFVDLMRDGLVASEFTAGCPVAASALAGPEVPAAVINAGSTFTGWVDAIAEVMVGEGIEPTRARSLAHLVVAAVEGATVVSIATHSTAPLNAVADELRSTLTAFL
jgi:TetR/AcrR family transcriptional repressor of lmrAB and yxaGH operons